MGGVVQQINLYRGAEQARAVGRDARLLMLTGVGALAAVLVLALAGEIYLRQVAGAQARVAEALRVRQAELSAYKDAHANPTTDPFLQAELTRLQSFKTHLDTSLAAITQHADAQRGGFSDVFSGLARNTVEGLWFREVGVSGGGSEMHLKGHTVEPALVPRLLQTLAQEQAFAGRTFRDVLFERRERESGALVEFELRSARGEGDGDES